MDKLDGGYIRGFTEGLKKAQEIIRYIYPDMKAHGRKKRHRELLEAFDCAIAERETLRENPEAFVRCSHKGGYEVYEPNVEREKADS